MMVRLLEKKPDCEKVALLLKAWIEKTRFKVGSFYPRENHKATPKRFKGGDILIYEVRQKTRKYFFGFEPCARSRPPERRGWNRRAPPKPAKLSFLGGLDWMEFNDTLNDCLDHYGIKADVATSRCILRKGFSRRTEYNSVTVSPGTMMEREIWKINEASDKFMIGIDAPLVPFSTTNASPGGFYRMVS